VICNVLIPITLPPESVGHRIYWIGPYACAKDGLDVTANQEYPRMFPTQLYSVTSRCPDMWTHLPKNWKSCATYHST